MKFIRSLAWAAACLAGSSALLIPAHADAAVPVTGVPQTMLHANRMSPTGLLLHDSRVLITGGDAAAVGTSAPADIYDPTTKLVSPTSSSAEEPRSDSEGVVLSDGRALIISDRDSAGAALIHSAAPAVIYDPGADTWTAVSAPPQLPSNGGAVLLADGTVELIGSIIVTPEGVNGVPTVTYATVAENYNPSTDNWSTPRTIATGAASTGQARVAISTGGYVVTSGGGGQLEIRSPGGTWSTNPSAGAGDPIALADGQVQLVAGAESNVYTYGPDATVILDLDPTTGVIRYAGRRVGVATVDPARPVAPGQFGPTLLSDGRILTSVADAPTAVGSNTYQDVMAVYDPATDLYSGAGTIGATYGGATPVALTDGSMLLAGAGNQVTDVKVPGAAGKDTTRLGDAASLLLPESQQQGTSTVIVGRLEDATAHPMVGKPVTLWEEPETGSSWTNAGVATTDSAGTVSFTRSYSADVFVALRHAGDSATAPAAAYELIGYPGTAPATPPPATGSAEPGYHSIRVAWVAPTSGSPSGYRVVVSGQPSVELPASATQTVVTGLTSDVRDDVQIFAEYGSSVSNPLDMYAEPEPDSTLAPDAPTSNPTLCGQLPIGTTVVSAGTETLCRAGVLVTSGAALVFDAAAGPIDLQAAGAGGISVAGGSLLTRNTAPGRGLSIKPLPRSSTRWYGIGQSTQSCGCLPYSVGPLIDPLTNGEHQAPSGQETVASVDLSDTALEHSVIGMSLQRGAAMRLVRGTVSDVTDQAWLADATTTDLEASTISQAGAGVVGTCFYYGSSFGEVDGSCLQTVIGTIVNGVRGSGISLRQTTHVHLQGDTVTNSGSPANPRMLPDPAVVVAGFDDTVGPGKDIDTDLEAGGDAVDAMRLQGTFEGPVTWVTPQVAAADHPAQLGWVADSLTVAPGSTLTLPAGAVVKDADDPLPSTNGFAATAGSAITVDAGGALDASAGGATFVGAADDSVGVPTCDSSLAVSCSSTSFWPGLTASAGSTVRLDQATIRGAGVALSSSGGTPSAPVALSEVTIENGGYGVEFAGGAASVTNSRFDHLRSDAITATAVDSLTLTGDNLDSIGGLGVVATHTFDSTLPAACGGPSGALQVANLSIAHTGGQGFAATGWCHPVIQQLDLRDTGNRPPSGSATDTYAAVISGDLAAGTGDEVDDITGTGNALDGVALGGMLETSLTWQTMRANVSDTPLGDAIDHTLNVDAGATLTFPEDSVVTGQGSYAATYPTEFYRPTLQALGGTIDASAGGLTGPSNPGLSLGVGTGILLLNDAQLPFAAVSDGAGTLDINNSSVGAVGAGNSASLSVSNSTVNGAVTLNDYFGQAAPSAPLNWSLTNDTISGTVSVAGSNTDEGDTSLPDLNLTMTGDVAAAYNLSYVATSLGPDGRLNDLQTRDGGALTLDQVRIDSDVTWNSDDTEHGAHPAGVIGQGVSVVGPHTVTIPSLADAEIGGLSIIGGSLDARASGARLAGSVSLMPDAAGDSGGAALLGVTGLLGLTATSTKAAPGDANHGVTIDNSNVPSVVLNGGSASISGSTLQSLRTTGATVALSQSVINPGIRYQPNTDAEGEELNSVDSQVTLDHVTVDGESASSYPGEAFGYSSAIRSSSDAASDGSLGITCSAIEDDGNGGVQVDSGSASISQSNLDGSAAGNGQGATYDLKNAGIVSVSGLWWGQSGGPVAGQVEQPAEATDLSPASSRVSCANANPVVPPSVPSGLTVLPRTVGSLTVTWTAALPGSSPLSSYTVTAQPGNVSQVVGPTATSAEFDGLEAGSAYMVSVTANAPSGNSTASLDNEVTTPSRAPTVTGLAFNGPRDDGAIEDGEVDPGQPLRGQTQPNATVVCHSPTGYVTSFVATVDADGNFTCDVALASANTSPTSYSAQATDAAGLSGPVATVNTDSSGPALMGVSAPATVTASNDTSVPVTGMAEAGATVTVSTSSPVSTSASATAKSDGTFNVAVNLSAQQAGSVTLSVTARSATGTTGATVSIEHDTDGPTVRGATLPDTVRRDALHIAPLSIADGTAVRYAGTATDGSGGSESQNTTMSQLDLGGLHNGSVGATLVPYDVAGVPGMAFMVTTRLAAEPAPATSLASKPSATSATLNWSAATDEGPDAVTWGIAISPAGPVVSIKGTSATVSGLAPKTTYTWSVSGGNNAGIGNVSTATFTTTSTGSGGSSAPGSPGSPPSPAPALSAGNSVQPAPATAGVPTVAPPAVAGFHGLDLRAPARVNFKAPFTVSGTLTEGAVSGRRVAIIGSVGTRPATILSWVTTAPNGSYRATLHLTATMRISALLDDGNAVTTPMTVTVVPVISVVATPRRDSRGRRAVTVSSNGGKIRVFFAVGRRKLTSITLGSHPMVVELSLRKGRQTLLVSTAPTSLLGAAFQQTRVTLG